MAPDMSCIGKTRTSLTYTLGVTGEYHAGCSKRPTSKAAGESKPETYPLGYVEDFDEPRTKLAGFFSILPGRGYDRDH